MMFSMLNFTVRRLGTIAAVLLCWALVGCEQGVPMAPVRGKVLYNGKPLEFGSVMFQPPGGQPARSTIGPDGSFVLTTEREGDGAVVGPNQVRIACFENQRPKNDKSAGEEPKLGESLIPTRYNSFEHSHIVIEVPAAGIPDLVLELNDEPPKPR